MFDKTQRELEKQDAKARSGHKGTKASDSLALTLDMASRIFSIILSSTIIASTWRLHQLSRDISHHSQHIPNSNEETARRSRADAFATTSVCHSRNGSSIPNEKLRDWRLTNTRHEFLDEPLAYQYEPSQNLKTIPIGGREKTHTQPLIEGTIPEDLSFLFRIPQLSVSSPVARSAGLNDGDEHWQPPTMERDCTGDAELLFRWLGGRVEKLANSELATGLNMEPFMYRSTSLYSRGSMSKCLLGAYRDIFAADDDTSSSAIDWTHVTLHDVTFRRSSDDDREEKLSVMRLGGSIGRRTRAHCSTWKHGILPPIATVRPEPGNVAASGLIGELNLLLAILAFCVPKVDMTCFLTSEIISPGSYVPINSRTSGCIYFKFHKLSWSHELIGNSIQPSRHGRHCLS